MARRTCTRSGTGRRAGVARELAGLEGVSQVWLPEEYAALGLPTPAQNSHAGDLLLEAAPGFSFVDDADGDAAGAAQVSRHARTAADACRTTPRSSWRRVRASRGAAAGADHQPRRGANAGPGPRGSEWTTLKGACSPKRWHSGSSPTKAEARRHSRCRWREGRALPGPTRPSERPASIAGFVREPAVWGRPKGARQAPFDEDASFDPLLLVGVQNSPNSAHRSPSNLASCSCSIGEKSVGLVLTLMPGSRSGSAKSLNSPPAS